MAPSCTWAPAVSASGLSSPAIAARQVAGSASSRASSCCTLSPRWASALVDRVGVGPAPGPVPAPVRASWRPRHPPGAGVAPGWLAARASRAPGPMAPASHSGFCSVIVTDTLARSGMPSGEK